MVWIAILLCLLVSFVFSGIEAGILSVNRVRLAHREKAGDEAAIKLNKLLADPERLLVTVLLVTNLDPELLHVQRYVMIATAVGLGGRIVKRHLGGQYSKMWVEVEGKVLHNASRKIETPDGQPDLVEQTIVSEVPQEPSGPTPMPPEAVLVIVAMISALVLAACAAPLLAFSS